MLDLLLYVLVKDSQRRPTIDDVLKRIQSQTGRSKTTPRNTPRGLTPRTGQRLTPRMSGGGIMTSGGVGMEISHND